MTSELKPIAYGSMPAPARYGKNTRMLYMVFKDEWPMAMELKRAWDTREGKE